MLDFFFSFANMGILGLFSSKVLAAGYGVVFSQVMFVLVAKMVSFLFFEEKQSCLKWRDQNKT